MLLNLYEPSNGSITINGLDINSYSKKASRKAFSLMAQDFGKYCISFYENIGISDLERIDDNNSKDLLIEDLDLSYLVNEIGGGNTVLGIDFGGKELSGGEWQKLALARALFKECNLFIFDEPTSAIDPLIENKILSKIAKLAEEKICFVISHRVGICKQAKRIFVMKNGELVQEGTHHELLGKNGIYKELWNAQAKWYVE